MEFIDNRDVTDVKDTKEHRDSGWNSNSSRE